MPWRTVASGASGELGESGGRQLVEAIFESDDVLLKLRKVQAVVRHLETFPPERAQAAARRALHFGSLEYRDILRTNEAVEGDLSYSEFLFRVCCDEVERREAKQLDLRLRRAAFDSTKRLDALFMNTHTRLRNRPPSAASVTLAALFGTWPPRRPFRVACVARTRKAPPGTELLCLEHVFMNGAG